MNWAYLPSATLLVQGRSYWLGVIGLFLSLIGFGVTIRQTYRTRRIAELLGEQVDRVRLNLSRYDASHEASKAETALTYARTHVGAGEWANVAKDYEEFLAAIHLIKELSVAEIALFDTEIVAAQQYGAKLCERIAAAQPSGLNGQESIKLLSAIRNHSQLIASIRVALQRSTVS